MLISVDDEHNCHGYLIAMKTLWIIVGLVVGIVSSAWFICTYTVLQKNIHYCMTTNFKKTLFVNSILRGLKNLSV